MIFCFRSYLNEIVPLFEEDDLQDETTLESDDDDDEEEDHEEDNSVCVAGSTSDTTISCMYPVIGKIDRILVVSAALLILMSEKNISAIALNCVLETLLVSILIV